MSPVSPERAPGAGTSPHLGPPATAQTQSYSVPTAQEQWSNLVFSRLIQDQKVPERPIVKEEDCQLETQTTKMPSVLEKMRQSMEKEEEGEI